VENITNQRSKKSKRNKEQISTTIHFV